MSNYFSLRKRQPEPVEEDVAEEYLDEENEPVAPESPASRGAALGLGLVGPSRWIVVRFGLNTAVTVHVIAVFSVFYYGGWIAAGVILVWLLAVLLFTPREFLDRLSAALERRDGDVSEAAPETVEELPVDPLVTVLWQLIADAPGTHLKTLTEHLQAAAPEDALDRATVRAKLGALSIPVRGSVRDAAGRVNEGVHRDDLTVWQEALPDPTLDPAPEPRSSAVATSVACDVADSPTPVATPFSRLRKALSRGGA